MQTPSLAMVMEKLPAVINRRADLAEVLLEQGANPCIPNENGETPLSQAQANDHPRMVDLLKVHIRQFHLKNGIFTHDELKQLEALLSEHTQELKPVHSSHFKMRVNTAIIKIKKAAIERLLNVPDKVALMEVIQDLKQGPMVSDKRKLLKQIEARLIKESGNGDKRKEDYKKTECVDKDKNFGLGLT